MLKTLQLGRVQVWNRWRSLTAFKSIDISGAVIKKTKLEGVKFYRDNLQGVEFFDVNLEWSEFKYCKCENADFRYSKLANSNFEGAICKGASFANTDLRLANFQDADLRGANFSYTNWSLSRDTINLKLDKKQIAQLLYHALINADNETLAEIKSNPVGFTKYFTDGVNYLPYNHFQKKET